MTSSIKLREATALKEAVEGKKYTWPICIIESDKMGSSGFYPRDVIERDGPLVFAQNTQIFIDHLSESEEWDRPEGSVHNLAGFISTTPEFRESSGDTPAGLYAEATFFDHYGPMIDAVREHVGMSIRAWAEADIQDLGAGPVAVITRLISAESVDVVTKAGAGGKILEAIESAKVTVPPGIKLTKENDSTTSKGTENNMTTTDEKLDALTGKIDGLVDALKNLATVEAAPKQTTDPDPANESVSYDDVLDQLKKVNESDLPAPARTRIIESLKAEPKADIDKMIESEKKYIESISTRSDVGFVGESQRSGDGVSDADRLAAINW